MWYKCGLNNAVEYEKFFKTKLLCLEAHTKQF